MQRSSRLLCATASVAFIGPFAHQKSLHCKTKPNQRVYVWGAKEQMPFATSDHVGIPQRSDWFENSGKVWKELRFGPTGGAAIDESGIVYIWGIQRSLGDKEEHVEEVHTGPKPIDGRWQDVQINETGIYVLGGGRVYTLNLDTPYPQPIDLPKAGWIFDRGVSIQQISVGDSHVACLTKDGRVFTFGSNTYGQCGVEHDKKRRNAHMMYRGAGTILPDISLDTPFRVATEEPIANVACGGRHTFLLGKSGRSFSFGDDSKIQLGLGDTRSGQPDTRNAYGTYAYKHEEGRKAVPKKVNNKVSYNFYTPHLQSMPVETNVPEAYNRPAYPAPISIGAGNSFTYMLIKDSPEGNEHEETNLLFCQGENMFGQCGRNRQNQQQEWAPVRLPKFSYITQFAEGTDHSVALLKSGSIWTWGKNSYGQLGCHGRATMDKGVRVYLEDPGPVDENGERPTENRFKAVPQGEVVRISCGYNATAAICQMDAS